MSLPEVVSRDEWLAARKELLAKEKQFTRERDALNADRRRLPMVEIDKDYVFEGPEGKVAFSTSSKGDNYRTKAEIEASGFPVPDWEQPFDLHGLSVFLRDGARVFHSYSTYGRGVDNLGFTSNFLDLTPLGRQEEWEEPEGRATGLGASAGGVGVRYHDEYDT
jgi:predicted dithiol-disulfide oxidoreductase (DUF899 family)